ncbi:RCC1/BLIP-II [Hypoxylon rubiginosum]|uniref:RCC1/BLIP-II n=1 Tax=Hypoxylon rubiginosum TaxID=110542 RepID=A0ACC0DJ87_9PEZI|nr:RCC1/BLIP-II [Hypoxylon rubiginosum]
MELLAAGFNAWLQLQFDDGNTSDEPDDITSFQVVLREEYIGRPSSLLPCTFVKSASGIKQAGFVNDVPENIKDKFLSSSAAIAGNGIIAEYDGRDTVYQYPFWPVMQTQKREEFSKMGEITQLVAYETGFVALSNEGNVWTWGDERYSACLGREITNSSPAEQPGLVEELQELPTGRIRKISAAGYVILALTEGHDLYAWGGHPGRPALLEDLSADPMPIVIEESDIVDCAAGESHLIVLTSDGDVYVIGSNTNGQLGLPVDEAKSWTKVPLNLGAGHVVFGVEAGQRTSFVLTKNQIPR